MFRAKLGRDATLECVFNEITEGGHMNVVGDLFDCVVLAPQLKRNAVNRPNAETNLFGNLHNAYSPLKLDTGAFKGERVTVSLQPAPPLWSRLSLFSERSRDLVVERLDKV
jgi:hypothetical protein